MVQDNYKKIQAYVKQKAFIFKIDFEDLLSGINMALAKAYSGDKYEHNSIPQFWGLIHTIINNEAINYKRNKANINSANNSDIDEVAEDYSKSSVRQPDFEFTDFSGKVLEGMKKIIKNQLHYQVFECIFLRDIKYEDCATELNIPIGTVKTVVHKIRKLANEKYGLKYKELQNE